MSRQPAPLPRNIDGIARLLRARANRHAVGGLLFALAAIALATILVCEMQYGEVSLANVMAAHKSNPALWLMNLMPILFLIWGQHVGMIMAYQASAMVIDETASLRDRADDLARERAAGDREAPPSIPGVLGREALLEHIDAGGRLAVLAFDCPQYLDLLQGSGETQAQALLLALCARLRPVLPENARLAHTSIADFALLVEPLRDADEARRIAARIQHALEAPLPVTRGAVSVRTHIGIALHDGASLPATLLLRRAETAKFIASAQQREQLNWTPELDEHRAEGPRLAAELHGALAVGGLRPRFRRARPLRASTPALLVFEPAWPHPRRGEIPAAQWREAYGRPGLASALVDWHLASGLEILVRERASDPQLGLLLRPPSELLQQSRNAESVLGLLAAHDVPASALKLELSETALMNGEQALSVCGQLARAGVGLALAGFGAPGASLAAARDYSLNMLRLADDAEHSRDHQGPPLLPGLLGIARQLGLSVIASGCRSGDDILRAEALDCDWVDGPAVAPLIDSQDHD